MITAGDEKRGFQLWEMNRFGLLRIIKIEAGCGWNTLERAPLLLHLFLFNFASHHEMNRCTTTRKSISQGIPLLLLKRCFVSSPLLDCNGYQAIREACNHKKMTFMSNIKKGSSTLWLLGWVTNIWSIKKIVYVIHSSNHFIHHFYNTLWGPGGRR